MISTRLLAASAIFGSWAISTTAANLSPEDVVIYGEHRQKFGTPEITLRGKRICVTGQISDYQGKPEIVLTDPSELTD